MKRGAVIGKLALILILIILYSPRLILGQINSDSTTFTQLTPYEMEMKNNWDLFLKNGGNWRDFLENKQYALDCKRISIFEYLTRLGIISVKTEIDSCYTVFAHGCRCGDSYLIEKGLADGTDIARSYCRGLTALMLTIQSDSIDMANLIIDQTTDINSKNDSEENAIILAAKYVNDTSFIKLLLLKGANVLQKNNHGYDALETAYFWGSDAVFNFLVTI